MKLVAVMLLVGFMHVSAGSLAQKITISQKNATLQQVFYEIHQQTGFQVLYKDQLLDSFGTIDVNFNDAQIGDVLQALLKDKGLDFELNDDRILIKQSSVPKTQENQQSVTKRIEGRVTDSKGNPIAGATIMIPNTSYGIVTDAEGNFSIKIPAETTKLQVSFVGMKTQVIQLSDQTTVDVTLKEDVVGLDEVVAVGYGVMRKSDLTGTVATIKAQEISQIKTQTIDQALVGQMPGVFVTASGGAPGSGAIVHVRGLASLTGDNQPLYVVDGVPIVQNPNFGTLGLGVYGERANPLLSINPNDIEQVDVLKDASSAAIYGSRAANGVILITTKRGTQNQAPKFNFSVNSTIQNPTNTYDYLHAEDWIKVVKGIAQSTLDSYPEAYWPYFPTQYAIVNDPNYFGTADTDWQKEILRKNALWNEYNFNVSGGTKEVSYFVSATASSQEGILKGSDFDRYSFSSSLDAYIKPKFKVGTSINYNYSVNKSSGLTSLQDGNFRPDLPVYNEDGSFTGTDFGYSSLVLNPLGDQARQKNKTLSQNMYGSVYGELEVVNKLKVRSRLNINLNDSKVEQFLTSYSEEALYNAAYYSEEGARLTTYNNAGYTLAFENTLNYNNTINGVHKLDALLGISWDKSRLDLESQTYLGFPDDEYLTNIQSANDVVDWGSESIENGLNSYFGRFNYAYDNRYLFTFTSRYDGSTKFGPDNKWGFFPSGAVAWNMHNENFIKAIPKINQLKLRASLGKTGQDNLPAFTYLAYYQSLDNGDSFYNGVNGIAISGVPNTGIKWETTNQLDLGLEFGLFDSRLNGEIVYFEKKTSDIILLVPITAETGSSYWQSNIADVSNKGWEISVNGDIIRKGDFRWNSAFNISFVKNNVDALKGGSVTSSGSTGIVEGQPIGVVVGYEVVKIAQTQDEIDALNEAAGGSYQSTLTQPGDYIFKDVSGPNGVADGIITTADMKPLGDINPKYFGGWNNKLSYKNFDLNFNWQFVQGAERSYEAITNLYAVSAYYNSTDLVLDTWSEDNKDATYARIQSGTHGYTPTSRSIVDASYIRLRSASVAYSLPKQWVAKIQASSARISFSGNNLITITDYPGLDPESVNTQRGGTTIDMTRDGGYSYPNARTFTVGLNVTF